MWLFLSGSEGAGRSTLHQALRPAPVHAEPVKPAHADMLRQLVATAPSNPAVLFLVAADVGWTPRSEELLQALGHFRLSRVVFVLTRVDLVPTSLQQHAAALRDLLQDSPFAQAPLWPVSTRTGQGVAELQAALEDRADDARPHPPASAPVFPLPDPATSTGTLDVRLERSARRVATTPRLAGPLPDRTTGQLWLGSQEVAAELFLHRGRALAAGECGLAQLRTHTPLPAWGGDRFLFREATGDGTWAGGVVLDPDGDRKYWQLKSQVALLAARAAALPGEVEEAQAVRVWLTSELARHGARRRADLLARCRFRAGTVQQACESLVQKGTILAAGPLAVDPGYWQALRARAMDAVDQVHRAHPDWVGLEIETLRQQVAEESAVPGLFEALLESLTAQELVQEGAVVRKASHQATLPARLAATADWLRAALAEKPFEPPSRKELMPDPASAQALEFLIATGEAVELGPRQVLSAAAYAQAVQQVRGFLRERGRATVSELRQLLGGTRRILVPLCEKLDQEGITRREGDHRVPGGC